jgi:prepilin-type N-terminal cleavage/methylation domain-containing protein
MKKAFTLIELVVAVALLAIVFSFAGVIFKVSIGSYRTACANAEIIQKLRAITDQLNADFQGLRKDGEIFVIWKAEPNSQERFDRIMFFADGDFQSYKPYGGGDPIHGNVARICYMLANKRPANIGNPIQERPYGGPKPEKRILSRTLHILTADPQFDGAPMTATPTGTSSLPYWYNWNNISEYDYDMNSLDKWKNMPQLNKLDVLSVITDVDVVGSSGVSPDIRGTMVDPADANLIHNIFCEGVGEFKVQGWYDAEKRWVPEFDHGDFDGLPANAVPGVLYPYPPYGQVILGGGFPSHPDYPFQGLLNEAHFNEIPGLGRALKFTFTLYDSKGVFKEGRTFTHIVYIGN